MWLAGEAGVDGNSRAQARSRVGDLQVSGGHHARDGGLDWNWSGHVIIAIVNLPDSRRNCGLGSEGEGKLEAAGNWSPPSTRSENHGQKATQGNGCDPSG